jgi:hypothetical protein
MNTGNGNGNGEDEHFLFLGGHLFLRGNICHVAFEPTDVESEEEITGAAVSMLTHEWTVRLSQKGARALFHFYRHTIDNLQQELADEMGAARTDRDDRLQQFEHRP